MAHRRAIGLFVLAVLACNRDTAHHGDDAGESSGAPSTSATTSMPAESSGAVDGSSDGGSDTGDQPPPPPTSPTAHVRFKGPARLANDYAQALALPVEDLCLELGEFDCTAVAHRVTLGGVAPYDLGLYRPLPQSSMTSPIAVDRIALAACGRRIDRDLAGEHVLFTALLQGDALADLHDAHVTLFLDALYVGAVQRHATATELDHLRALYSDVAATSDAPARDWATLSCFAVLTTFEALFY